jgi:hypothetical protein
MEGIASDEIFFVDDEDPTNYIKNLVEEAIQFLTKGVRKYNKKFYARPHQEWVNSVILDRWEKKTMLQPLDAGPRFGKTEALLDLFHKMQAKVMVLASYVLSANESFRERIEDTKYDITADIAIVKPVYSDVMDAIERGQRVLIDVSLHVDESTIDTELLDFLSTMNNLVVVDEADFGAWTKASKDVLNKFVGAGKNLVVLMTGTNMERALINSITTSNNINEPIFVSYLDLLEAKYGNGFLFDERYIGKGSLETNCLKTIRQNRDEWKSRLKDIVEVSSLALSVDDVLVEHLNDLSGTERANMRKIFSKRNSHIQHDILRQLFDMAGNGTDVFSIYRTTFGPIVCPTAVMYIPGDRKDIDNLVNIGRTILPDYEWVALHGESYDSSEDTLKKKSITNRTAQTVVMDIINNTKKNGVIVVSIGMGSRSWSIPNCCITINANDGGSYATANQKASRCLTPGANKKSGLVINYGFDLDRTSKFETDLIRCALNSKIENEPVEHAIRRVYGLVNFLRLDEYGYAMKLAEDDFVKLVTSPSNLNNMAVSTINYDDILTDDVLVSIIRDIKNYKETVVDSSSKINKAKTFIENIRESSGDFEEEDSRVGLMKTLVKKIETIVNSVGNLHVYSPTSETFIEALEEVSTNEVKFDAYTELTGISPKIVLDHLAEKLPTTFLDMIILRARSNDDICKYIGVDGCEELFDV